MGNNGNYIKRLLKAKRLRWFRYLSKLKDTSFIKWKFLVWRPRGRLKMRWKNKKTRRSKKSG